MAPQLRFPAFTDTWQMKSLGSISNWSSGGTPAKDNPRYWGGNIPWISAASMYGKYFDKSDRTLTESGVNSGSKMAAKGSLLLLVRGSMLFNTIPIGIASKDVTFNQDVKAIIGRHVDQDYLYYWFKSSEHKLLSQVVGTGIGAGKLDTDQLKSMQIGLPTKIEQEKIADFLTVVDERIAASEKKLELLEAYKRGVMQQIFSQKIRFKDENGKQYPDWKEKAVSEFLKERKEYTSKGGDLEHISLTTAGVVPKSERYERDFLVGSTDKQYRITRLDDICYNPANLKFGVIARNKYKDGIFSPIYVTYVVDNADIGFVEYLVTSRDFIQRARKYEQGTVYERMAVSPQDIAKLKVRMPVIEEQQKIATFLATLDEKITAEKSKLTAAKQFKKALLQRMFV